VLVAATGLMPQVSIRTKDPLAQQQLVGMVHLQVGLLHHRNNVVDSALVVMGDHRKLEDQEMVSGRMESMFQDLPISDSNASSLESQMILSNSRLVSILKSMMTFQLRLPGTIFPRQLRNSPTHLSTHTCLRISSLQATRFRPLFKSTLFRLLWAAEI
jgi:hypothetical protein